MGEMLEKAQAPQADQVEPEAITPEAPVEEAPKAPEAPAPVATPEVKTEAVAAASVTPAVTETPQEDPGRKFQGIMGALQAERLKRQSLEARLAELEGTSVPQEAAQSEIQSLKTQLYRQSEHLARLAHPDYDEVYADFEKEALNNEALAITVLNSEVPAEAAYQAGLNIRLQKKYGVDVVGNPMKLKEALEKEIRADERARANQEFQAQLSAKATQRSKTPTDISLARAAGGSTVSEYQSPSFGEALRAVHRRR